MVVESMTRFLARVHPTRSTAVVERSDLSQHKRKRAQSVRRFVTTPGVEQTSGPIRRVHYIYDTLIARPSR